MRKKATSKRSVPMNETATRAIEDLHTESNS